MTIPSFPKIFAIGSKQTERLLSGEVEITEKIDGSQIGFGNLGGALYIRSKGAQLYVDNPDKMFGLAVELIKDRFDRNLLTEGIIYYGEYLKTERHNVIHYGRVPLNHIALYGVLDTNNDHYASYHVIQACAKLLEFETVPLLHQGKVTSIEELKSNLSRISVLGKEKIEGFVIKNYNEQLMIGGQVIPILMGKFVSEDFKEVHKKEWKSANTSKGKWEIYKSQFCNTARWLKAIHFLRDCGQLEQSPKDIGKLIKRIQDDINEEEKANIQEWLFNEFGSHIGREAVKGFPQWYKEYLLQKALHNEPV